MRDSLPVDAAARMAQTGVTVTAVTFLSEALHSTVVWLMVMIAIVICSLVMEIRCKIMTGEHLVVRRVVLRAMGDIVTYTSLVFAICMLEVAAGGSTKIDKICCCMIYGIELGWIIRNYLKPKKIDFDIIKFVAALLNRVFGINKGDTEEIVKKIDKED